MPLVFLSYSSKDHHFAELATLKLQAANISVWKDRDQLRAGRNWRDGIERGIADSIAVLVALSESSVASPYVTFEWAYGLGKSKTLVPLKLEECEVPPRLEPIQYLDFSIANALPWDALVEHIREIEAEATSSADVAMSASSMVPVPDPMVTKILDYMRQKGFQYISYSRIRSQIDERMDEVALDSLVRNNPECFRQAELKEGRKGLKKLVP
jgi:hypothetical protein